MIILAIDTSCDDTSAAVVKDKIVLSNVISSQTELHNTWGGVVPIIAKRAHQERIDAVISKALQLAKVSIQSIEVVAVTYGPGLAIALEVGVKKGKELALQLRKPLIAVNHMEGHLYSVFAQTKGKKLAKPQFPVLALLVSGKHTELVFMKEHGEYKILGATLDDAVGEAFDKVARLLGLGYPGGAILSLIAKRGNPNAYSFTVPLHRRKDLDFSYSGIKAAMVRLVKQITMDEKRSLTRKEISDLSASFQKVAIQHLVERTKRALQMVKVKSLIVGGGVSANLVLRNELRKICRSNNIPLFVPSKKILCMDNAAMIGVAAWYKAQRKEFVEDVTKLERDPIASIDVYIMK
ncbi:MAG: tRNA (adenosine(37)-N6)-threonylcarbamoyltransferase complex transferase subunit TsaD [Patescibacteria group bacterium]